MSFSMNYSTTVQSHNRETQASHHQTWPLQHCCNVRCCHGYIVYWHRQMPGLYKNVTSEIWLWLNLLIIWERSLEQTYLKILWLIFICLLFLLWYIFLLCVCWLNGCLLKNWIYFFPGLQTFFVFCSCPFSFLFTLDTIRFPAGSLYIVYSTWQKTS